MQVTAFVALLALDAQRISQRRCDAAPCIRLPASLMYGQEGQDGQNGESGQKGQLDEPLVEGSSGEMPLSTQDMYRESIDAAPAGESAFYVLLSAPEAYSCALAHGCDTARAPAFASMRYKPTFQARIHMSLHCDLELSCTRNMVCN